MNAREERSPATERAEHAEAIVLFDGVCNVCDASVRFVFGHDRDGVFRFAPLQSPIAKSLLHRHHLPSDDLDTVVLIEGDHVSTRSTAALRIVRRLGGAWPLLYGLIVVPRPLRDAAYRWFANNRYRWFGRRESCAIPAPGLRERFLDPPKKGTDLFSAADR